MILSNYRSEKLFSVEHYITNTINNKAQRNSKKTKAKFITEINRVPCCYVARVTKAKQKY